MNIRLEKSDNYLNYIKDLYEEAFPDNERCDFNYLLNERYANFEIFVVTDKKNFIGFIFVAIHKNIAYVNYFAIKEEFRNCGYGSKALKLLESKFKGYDILLSVEKPVTEIQKRRLKFYQRNNFVLTEVEIKSNDVDFLVLCNGKYDLAVLQEFFKIYFPKAEYL